MGTRKKREKSETSTNDVIKPKGKFSSHNVRQKHHDSNLSDSRSFGWKLLVFALALTFGLLQRYHVAAMFENDRHFSYLSDLEREMTFRTEMGLYYSYFKTLINAPSITEGLSLITRDNVTEYGHTINTLKRFNLYPELILAATYRTYMSIANVMNYKTQECWHTERGKDMEPIISCEGMGNQFYFYVNNVFAISGLSTAALFLFGVLLSNSIFGGLLACSSFFFNHGEATRVQWTPPLRESFGYPIFLIQMLVVSYLLKYKLEGRKWVLVISFLTITFMLFWQFASFALSTQVGCIFITYVFGYIPSKTLRTITWGLLLGFMVSFVLLFGNEMLLTSLFFSSLITVQLVILIEKLTLKIPFRLIVIVLQIVTFAVGTLSIKFAVGHILNVKDDAHVFDILKAKFSNYSDFHTRLYTCAAEFDFMSAETPWKLTYTLVLPAAFVAVLLAVVQLARLEWNEFWFQIKLPNKPDAEIVYNILQLTAFTVMAVLIMRLKLFFTPHLCLITSLLASKKLLNDLFGPFIQDCFLKHRAIDNFFGRRFRKICQQAFCVALIGSMAIEGLRNLRSQWKIMGEYSNPHQEHLFGWIVKNTPRDAVFAGTMPTMANVKLSTGRPIVNHPHYEDADLRERTVKVYSIFSRKPVNEVHKTLKDMGINYFVFEYGWCVKGGKPGCSMPELFDLHDFVNKGKEPLCEKLNNREFGPFSLAYENTYYKIFKL